MSINETQVLVRRQQVHEIKRLQYIYKLLNMAQISS